MFSLGVTEPDWFLTNAACLCGFFCQLYFLESKRTNKADYCFLQKVSKKFFLHKP